MTLAADATPTPPRVLVVEDEEAISQGLAFNLRRKGYDVTVEADGRRALDLTLARRRAFDLIVLDVRLPGVDGFEICQRLRQAADFTPILMLTARAQPDDVIFGLKAGADDYVVKPFELAELLARVEGLLRRRAWARHETGSGPAPPIEAPGPRAAGDPVEPAPAIDAVASAGTAARRGGVSSFGDYWIDFDSYEAKTERGTVMLSQKEIAVMRVFIDRPRQVVSRRELLAEVWRLPHHPNERVVDNVIVALRQHFEADSSRPQHIQSVRGAGYRFTP